MEEDADAVSVLKQQGDAKQCPHCARWATKDDACAWVACGVIRSAAGTDMLFDGCGRQFCWACRKKLCTLYFDPATRERVAGARDAHDAECCSREPGFRRADYCGGGHNSHCPVRWPSPS